ncbi:MAG: ABC-2 family transporter protein [Anaerolineae bacterium]
MRLNVIWLFFKLSVLNELQYRANFFVQLFQSALALVISLGGLVIVFDHTDSLNGWRPPELLAVLGVYFIIGGFIYTFIQPSMQKLMEDVRLGTLDFVLLKPVESQLMVSVRQIQIWKLIDIGVGLGVLTLGLRQMDTTITAENVLFFLVLLVLGGLIVYSFWLILATISFWFVRIDNILVIFQSMYEAGRWPVRIYPGWLQFTLTFLVPVAFAVTVPVEALTGRLTTNTLITALVLALLMLTTSRIFWMIGVRHYSGASA